MLSTSRFGTHSTSLTNPIDSGHRPDKSRKLNETIYALNIKRDADAMARFTLPFTATKTQATTYLCGVALFSISFLVFLNSAISFVITDRIGQKEGVGDAVGTLGFADELVVVVACPIWGVLSDRIGLRLVTVAGYVIVGLSLMVFVQAQNVYPQLLLGRMFFAVGAAATSTMVTAILPSMTYKAMNKSAPVSDPRAPEYARTNGGPSHSVTPSISSELTITPTRYRTQSDSSQDRRRGEEGASSHKSTSQLSGLVGMFTGCGALIALGLFLPLPTRFQKNGVSPSEAVADSFYVVGAVALVVGILCAYGLRNLPGESHKSWKKIIYRREASNKRRDSDTEKPPSYARLLLSSISLGMRDSDVGLGYVGGFVARASSVAISLFIPLFVNQYFISSGKCPVDPGASPLDPGEAKRNCQRAYIVASILTGVSQLIALLCAPVFGYLNAHYSQSKLPLLIASAAGVGGYSAFGVLKSPDPTGHNGNAGVFLIVALLGISQIGAIVSSLDLISRGVSHELSAEDEAITDNTTTNGGRTPNDRLRNPMDEEEEPLIPGRRNTPTALQRDSLKGSVAGIYSLAGGVGILILTKLGGALFDKVDVGSPFFMMAGFNALLFVLTLVFTCMNSFRYSNDDLETHGLLTTPHDDLD